MEDIDSLKEQYEQKIEYKCPSYWWWGMAFFSLFILIFISPTYFEPNVTLTFQMFISLWIIFFIILVVRSPKKITIKADMLTIIWLLGKSNILKSEVKKIVKWKAPNRYYVFWIIRKKTSFIMKGTNLFPIFVDWTQKPYYDLEPSKVYDIVEKIEFWIKQNKGGHNNRLE